MTAPMDLSTFVSLPTADVAARMRDLGQVVCGFPINGTRRWFEIEHGTASPLDYVTITWRRTLEVYRLCFEHGIHTILAPIFGPELLERGPEYLRLLEGTMGAGLRWARDDPFARSLYEELEVGVGLYGDGPRDFAGTPIAAPLDHLGGVAVDTAEHDRHQLLFGVCAQDATASVARIGVEHHAATGRLPTRDEIVRTYYGRPVGELDLFLGFGRPAIFDVPLVAVGRERIYTTVSPGPWLDRETLRRILWDFLFHAPREVDGGRSPEELTEMAEFYRRNRRGVLGVGERSQTGSWWRPTPQVGGSVPPSG